MKLLSILGSIILWLVLVCILLAVAVLKPLLTIKV